MAEELILIVEDDAIIASMLCGMLSDSGYPEPLVVASGESAIEAVKTESPSLVLMDIKLAGDMDGVAAAERIHAISDLPIVYLTAYAEDQLIERAKPSVPYGYLVKPVSERELQATIKMALYRHALDHKLAESEQSLRESEELSRSLLDLGSRNGEAIVMLQDEEGHQGLCVYANEPFCHIAGFSQEELRDVQLFDLVHPRNRAAALREHQRRMAGENTPGYTEMTLITRSGQEIDLECTFACSYYRGRPADVGYLRNLSRRRKAEEQVVVDERLSAIGNVIATIAGTLDSHFSSINECFEAFDDARDLPAKAEDLINHMNDASELIENLLEYVDGHDAGSTPVSVNQSIETALKIRSLARPSQNIQIKKVLEPDLPLVVADGYRLRQVLLNILTNADYVMTQAHSGGSVSVVTEDHTASVRISIADTGPGVAAGNGDGLLGPSLLRTMTLGGSGLSMSVCRHIIEASGGSFNIEYDPGKGTTYIIDLPTAAAKTV